jgi:hypothetical protein
MFGFAQQNEGISCSLNDCAVPNTLGEIALGGVEILLMRPAHLLTPLIIVIVGTNPITIVAQGAMEVCDAAHCSEVMKTSAQTNSGYIAPTAAASGGLHNLHARHKTDGIRLTLRSNVTPAHARSTYFRALHYGSDIYSGGTRT